MRISMPLLGKFSLKLIDVCALLLYELYDDMFVTWGEDHSSLNFTKHEYVMHGLNGLSNCWGSLFIYHPHDLFAFNISYLFSSLVMMWGMPMILQVDIWMKLKVNTISLLVKWCSSYEHEKWLRVSYIKEWVSQGFYSIVFLWVLNGRKLLFLVCLVLCDYKSNVVSWYSSYWVLQCVLNVKIIIRGWMFPRSGYYKTLKNKLRYLELICSKNV